MSYTGSVPETERASDWRDNALCGTPQYRGHANLWFPKPADKEGTAAAKKVCSACPVRQTCLDDALAEEGGQALDKRYGIRGGKTAGERLQAYRRARDAGTPVVVRKKQPARKKRQPAKCGTNSGYAKHLRDKTKICDPCRQAHTDADNLLRRTGTTKATEVAA